MAEASRRSGLTDFGDERFRTGLGVLVESFNQQDTAHAFGRIFFREFVVGLLVNRLKIQADLKRHPEILDVPVPRPLFITGLPRSGTTFLHRLMSQDPSGRSMLFWETVAPTPPPRRETYATDPRIAEVRRKLDLLHRLAPRLAIAHEFEAQSPDEDNNLFAHDFAAAILGFMFDVPDYVRWLNTLSTQELVGTYRYVKQQLQLLSWQCAADYWVLKAPGHLYSIESLMSVYPDACVVVTHRDPLQVIPSLCSLAAGFRGMFTNRLDLNRLGAELVEAMAIGPERMMAARATADHSRFYDVTYERLVAQPIETVRDVCRYFGYDFSPSYEARARRWLAENPYQKHGIHHYRLDDFGLDAGTVERHFVSYSRWFAAHAE
jgi:hypothetical protein